MFLQLFLFLLKSSFSIEIAIDWGSSFVKASIVENNDSPTIALNYQTKPLTPNFLALKASEFNFSSKDIVTP